MAFADVGAWIGNHRRAVKIGTAVSLVLTLLVGISGTLATRRVVDTPPIVSLRDT